MCIQVILQSVVVFVVSSSFPLSVIEDVVRLRFSICFISLFSSRLLSLLLLFFFLFVVPFAYVLFVEILEPFHFIKYCYRPVSG